MNGHKPAIVLLGFNRPSSIERALMSIGAANFEGETDIPLVISLDRAENPEIIKVANDFKWSYGPKEIIVRSTRLGMREHSLACGDLTEKFGSIIFLEDDSVVSNSFYTFAKTALDFCEDDDCVAAVSLYNFDFSEFSRNRFIPISDGSDIYYMKMASTWAMAWSRKKWVDFRKWFDVNAQRPIASVEMIHPSISSWPRTSWKKHLLRYLASENRYFIFPRVALATNFGEAGSHFSKLDSNYQSPLEWGRSHWSLVSLSSSAARYDGFFELEPECFRVRSERMADVKFDVNLNGFKKTEHFRTQHVLQIGRSDSALTTFGLQLIPIEDNIARQIPGDGICLVPVGSRIVSDTRLLIRARELVNKYIGLKYLWQALLVHSIDYLRSRFLK